MKDIIGKLKVNRDEIRKNLTLIGVFLLIVLPTFFHFHSNYSFKRSLVFESELNKAKNDLKLAFRFIVWSAEVDTTGFLREQAELIGIRFVDQSDSTETKAPQFKKN